MYDAYTEQSPILSVPYLIFFIIHKLKIYQTYKNTTIIVVMFSLWSKEKVFEK